MNKIIIFPMVGILIFSGFGVVSLHSDTAGTLTITQSILFSEQPQVERIDSYLKVVYDGANSKLLIPGEPELPIFIKTFTLPKNAQKIHVECTIKNTSTMKLPGQIVPVAIYPLDIEIMDNLSLEKNEQTYQSKELIPSTWFNYDVGRGLDRETRVTFVKIVCNVVRYAPALNTIEYMNEAVITVTYENPQITSVEPDIYDMVIIAPEKFAAAFQPLIDHKNDHGLNTTLKTVENILVEYGGFDAPEKIKYFIKDAIEQWGITYVLLGGGLKSHLTANDKDDANQGTKDWYVPVRYTNIFEYGGGVIDPITSEKEHGVISDLYYADIYDENGNFSSWDPNEDGVFAAWDKDGVEDDTNLDLYPDVYVARLPCRNEREVKLLVKKIIVYESTNPASELWYNKMIAIAGRTFDIYNGQPDGEYICDVSINYMGDHIKKPIRVYASNQHTGGLTPVPTDIIEAFNGGAGFVHFQGHGWPLSWNTRWDDNGNWTGGINLYQFWRLFNGNKLPVVVVGGCHNGLINVTIEKTLRTGFPKIQERLCLLNYYHINLTFMERILDRLLISQDHYWTYGYPVWECFSWGLCLIPWGGAIASTGCTGWGLGSPSDDPIGLSSELEVNFFYLIGQMNASTLAWAHGGSITKFLNENWIDKYETICITVYQAFGDPSLKFGGYEAK